MIEKIKKNIENEIEKITHEKVKLETSKFADFSTSIAFKVAKGKNVNEVAKEIASKIKNEYIEKVEVVNGFINIYINYSKLFKDAINEEINFKSEREKYIVEHTSVNPNKPLHIGHARNSFIGDFVKNILETFGNEVVVINYIDDTGVQVVQSVLGFKELNFPFENNKKFDQYCGEIYSKVHEELEKNEELKKKERLYAKLIEEGNNEIALFARKMSDKVLKEQLKSLEEFNVFYDLAIYESDILHYNLWEKTLKKLKEKNLVYVAKEGDKKGCLLFKLSSFEEFKKLKSPDKVLVKSDGTLTYTAKDLAYAFWKHGIIEDNFNYCNFYKQKNGKMLISTCKDGKKLIEWKGIKNSIQVIDVRQSYPQKVVKIAVESFGDYNYIHLPYEVVGLSKNTAKLFGLQEKAHMKGRKGIYITLDELYNKVIEKIKEVMKEREIKNKEETIKKIAKAVIKFSLLKRSRDKVIYFDIEEDTKLNGKTATYILYSLVRAKKIIKKIDSIGNFNIAQLKNEEKELIKELLMYKEVVKEARIKLEPYIIINYLLTLADKFNKFYDKCKVIGEEENIKNFRANLTLQYIKTVSFLLKLIGIEEVNEM